MTKQGPESGSALSAFFAPEIRVWRGKMPLRIVFWGYGVGVSLALVLLYGSAVYLEELLFQQALLFLGALYTVLIVVGIWRCSPNAEPFWGTLARLLTVAWALNSGFVIVFLQFDLLVRYAQG